MFRVNWLPRRGLRLLHRNWPKIIMFSLLMLLLSTEYYVSYYIMSIEEKEESHETVSPFKKKMQENYRPCSI